MLQATDRRVRRLLEPAQPTAAVADRAPDSAGQERERRLEAYAGVQSGQEPTAVADGRAGGVRAKVQEHSKASLCFVAAL